MLKEKSIIDLCKAALRSHCKDMLKCESIEFGSTVENFDDLQKPIMIYAINMNENIGFKQRYTCTLTEDPEAGLLVNLTKFNQNIN